MTFNSIISITSYENNSQNENRWQLDRILHFTPLERVIHEFIVTIIKKKSNSIKKLYDLNLSHD